AMVIFTPWAFGTTQEWSIRIMNSAGFATGALFLIKALIRWSAGYIPDHFGSGAKSGRFLTAFLAVLTVLTLLWCWISARNASATYSATDLQFDYREYLPWLPHSFDARRSWPVFWNYTA